MKNELISHLKHAMGVFYDVLNTTDNFIILCDHHRRVLFINPALSRFTGYSNDEFPNKPLTSIFTRAHRAAYAVQLTKNLREKGVWHGEAEIQCKGAASFWAEIHIMHYSPPESAQQYVVCFGHDLTPQRIAAEQVWRARNSSGRLLDSMRDGLYVIEQNGTIKSCNNSMLELIGYRRDELLGLTPPYPWLRESDALQHADALKMASKGNLVSNFPLTFKRKNNSNRRVTLSISSFPDKTNQGRKCFIVSVRDVSNIEYIEKINRAEARIELLQAELRRKSVTLNTIFNIQQLRLQQAEISKIFKEIIAGVQKLLQSDLAGVFLIDRKMKTLSPKVLSRKNSFTHALGKFSLPLGKGLVGSAAVSGRMMIVNNAHMDPRSIYPRGKKPAMEHIIVVPLRMANRIFGVLAVARNRQPEFMDDDAQIIKSFAEATTLAIENARLVREAGGETRLGLKNPNIKRLNGLHQHISSLDFPDSTLTKER
ncbi:MAG: PAS domain S-box protein [Bacteroidota bacterium]